MHWIWQGQGRKSTLTVTSVRAVKDVTERDQWYTIPDVYNITRMRSGTVYGILTENLNMKKISLRWVPILISNDETRIFLFDPESKKQSWQWKTDGSPPPKVWWAKSIGKLMYIFFMDWAGMLLQHAVPLNTTGNTECYWKVELIKNTV